MLFFNILFLLLTNWQGLHNNFMNLYLYSCQFFSSYTSGDTVNFRSYHRNFWCCFVIIFYLLLTDWVGLHNDFMNLYLFFCQSFCLDTSGDSVNFHSYDRNFCCFSWSFFFAVNQLAVWDGNIFSPWSRSRSWKWFLVSGVRVGVGSNFLSLESESEKISGPLSRIWMLILVPGVGVGVEIIFGHWSRNLIWK